MVLFDASNSMGNRAFGGDGEDNDDDDDDDSAFDDDEAGDDDEEEVDDVKMKAFEELIVALWDDPRVEMLRKAMVADPLCYHSIWDEDAAVAALVGCVGSSLIRYGHAHGRDAQGRRRLQDLFAHSRYVMNREQGGGGGRESE